MSRAAAPGQAAWWRPLRYPGSWVFAAAVALFVVISLGAGTAADCSASQPCAPDWTGAVILGLLTGSAFTVFVHRWTAAVLAVALNLTWLAWEQLSGDFAWWVQVAALAYAALCLFAAARPEHEPAPPALTLPVPEPVGSRPRLGRGWRLVAGALALVAAAITWGTLAQQYRVQAQEDAAATESAQVTGHVDQTTITARFDGADARVSVLDAGAYPVGSSLRFRVDAHGLRQPVSEPYDVTGVLVFAEMAGALALAALLRARSYEAGLRAFLRHPQPARLVRVIDADGIIAVYPFEPATELDPPYLIYRAHRRGSGLRLPAPTTPDGDARTGDARTSDARTGDSGRSTDPDDPANAPVLATLYGVDRPGHWCAAAVDGTLLTPARPAIAGADQDYEPETLDTPVPVAELLPADRVVDFRVREHQRATAPVTVQAVLLGILVVLVFARFMTLSPVGSAVLAAVILGLSSEVYWRTQLRPRAHWHGAGLAVLTPFGGFTARWDDVVQVAAGRADVTVVADGIGGTVVPTRRRFGPPAERSARQLALALRHTRQHSLLGEPPALPAAPRPVGLYLACAAVLPLLVAALHWIQLR
jgi:hypothetical protein